MIILCDRTALNFFRSHRFKLPQPVAHKRDAGKILENAQGSLSKERTSELRQLGILPEDEDLPAHVVLPSANKRRKSKDYVGHVWSGQVSAGMFLQICPDVAILAPEALLLQLAGRMPFEKLLLIAMEFFGRYLLSQYAPAWTPCREGRAASRPRPRALTSVAETKDFLKPRVGEFGAKKLGRVLRYAVDKAWSPMESVVYLLLCLPRRMGGYGLPKAELNKKKNFLPGMEPVDGRSWVYCDLLWESRGLSLEYDGKLDDGQDLVLGETAGHFSRSGKVRDERKRVALAAMGIEMLSVSAADVYSPRAANSLAAKLAKRLGMRQKPESDAIRQRRTALREMILPRSSQAD